MADFDIKLTIDGIAKGLNLVSQDNSKMWKVSEVPRTLVKGAQETIDYASLDADKELIFFQTDWSGGFGQGNFVESNRYATGVNIDTTQYGKFFLGPYVNEQGLALESIQEVNNAGDSTAYHAYGTLWITQTFTTVTAYTATKVKVKVYRVGSPGTVTVSIRNTDQFGNIIGGDLAVGTFNGDAITTDTAGEVITVTFSASCSLSQGLVYATIMRATSGSASNKVMWRMTTGNVYAGGCMWESLNSGVTWAPATDNDFYFENWGLTSLGSAILGYEYFPTNGKLYCFTALKIFEWDVTNSVWVLKKTYTTGGNITQLHSFAGYLFIARGNGTAYEYTANLTDFITSTLADKWADYFIVAPSPEGTTFILWKAKTPNQLTSNTSGINGGLAWSTPAYIGDTSTNITGLMMLNDILLIGKTDNLFEYDTNGKIHPLMNELRLAQSTNNFKYHCNWHSALYFSLGSRIGELTSRYSFQNMGPLKDIEEVDIKGTCVGLVGDRDWIYAIMNDGTATVVYKGRLVNDRWQWCPWASLVSGICATAFLCQLSSENPKLWFNSTNIPCWITLSDNPLADTKARFASQGNLVTGWFDANFRAWDKLIQSIIMECRGSMSSTIMVTPYYEKDESGTYTQVGSTSYIAAGSPTKKYFTAATSYKKIRFKLQLDSNSVTITPVVKEFSAHGQLKPEYTKLFDFTVLIGATKDTPGKTMRDFVVGGRTSTALITLEGRLKDDTNKVIFLPGYPEEIEIFDEELQQPTIALHILAMKVDYV